MATNWTDAEVLKLIELWKEEGIQEQLEGSTRNKHVYVKLASQLAKEGVEKTGEQCRCKVKKLRQEYKKIKDNHKLTGRGRRKWKFYDVLNEILGNRPATHPPVVVDTSEDPTAAEEIDGMSDEEEVAESEKSLGSVGESSVTNSSANVDDTDIEPSNSTSSSRSATPVSNTSSKGRNRKRSKAEMLEGIMSNAMKAVTEGLKESDRMFIELEEKRMKFEEQQKREERNFQLQMMQMLVGSAHPSSHPTEFHAPYYPSYPPYGPPSSRYYPGPGDAEDS